MVERLGGVDPTSGVDLSASEKAKTGIRHNAEQDVTWKHHEIAKKLYGWTDIFRDRFLDPVAIPGREGKLPGPVLGFDSFDYRILAYYRLGKNAFGLDDEIILNEAHLDHPFLWSVLETVLHEQVHLWQQRQGKNPVDRNYHNKEFVAKCEQLGVHPRTGDGVHWKPADGAFAQLMKQSGIARPDLEFSLIVPKHEKRDWWVSPGKEREGRSTLSKWSCGCQNVRVGTKEFFACCLKCGNIFVRADGAAERPNAGGSATTALHQPESKSRVIYDVREMSSKVDEDQSGCDLPL